MPMTSTEMIKFLKKNGFIQIAGGKGSHKKFYNQSTGKSTVVPDISRNWEKAWSIKF